MLPCNTPMNNVVHISGTQSDAGLGSFRYTNGATSGTVENPNVGGRVLSGVNGMINYGGQAVRDASSFGSTAMHCNMVSHDNSAGHINHIVNQTDRQVAPHLPFMMNYSMGRQMNMNLQERASAPVVSSTQSGQTFVKSNMLQDQMPGFGPGPLHVRMSIPMHRTVAPYMIPNGPQNYVMEKRTKLGADMQMQNADSIFMQPPKSQSAVFHHHHQQQAIRSTVDHSQPCGCNNCVNTMVPSGGLTGDMRLTAAVPMHSSATPSFRQMSSMQTSEPMMTSNDANRLLSASGMQLPAAGSSVHFSTPCVGYTPSACASSRAAVNQSHQPVAIKQTDNQFMRQINPAYNSTNCSLVMPDKMDQISKDACDLNYRDSVQGQIIFPVSNGVILQTFKLEHNAPTTSISFHLKDDVYSSLFTKSWYEIELRCFRNQNMDMTTDWPDNLTVFINMVPVAIDRGSAPNFRHRPALIKRACQMGMNVLQINVTSCCCSHLFLVRMVNVASVTSIIRGLLGRRLLHVEYCCNKIKRYLPLLIRSAAGMSVAGNVTNQTAEALLTLKCPLAMRRMNLPARGHGCEHIQCFDLESYLKYNEDCGSWKCPICCAIAIPNSLEIDHYMWAIIRELSASNVDQVYIDSMGNWRPFIAGESQFIRPGGADTSLRMMSKFNTALPTVQSWSGNVRSKSGTCQPPASPSDSMIPFSPLSVASEYGVAASPRQQANTPDCIIISSSPAPASEVSNVVSPPAVPCSSEFISSSAVLRTADVASASLAVCSTNVSESLSASQSVELASGDPFSQKYVTSSVGAPPSARDPDRPLDTLASLSSVELGSYDRSNKDVTDINVGSSAAECHRQVTSRSDSMTMKFNCALFSKEDEQKALEDILSDAMPDLSDLIPLTSDGSSVGVDCPLPEDDFLL